MSHAYTFATTRNAGNIKLQMALYVIAMHVNVETGLTYCGIKTLMREAKVRSDRTMRSYIKQLEDDGLIRRTARRRDNGGKTSDEIELVGFLEWREREYGTRVASPAAENTGGSKPRQDLPDPSGNLPDPSGNLLTGPSGKQVTGQCEHYSNTKSEQEPPSPLEERVSFLGGQLQLGGDLRAFWLGRYNNDAERLDLALIQAAGYVQPNSSRPLEAQVSSQLARILSDRRDRDNRYIAAAAANKPKQPKPQKASRWAVGA